MKCVVYDTRYFSLVCFVGKDYPETDVNKMVEEYEPSYITFVISSEDEYEIFLEGYRFVDFTGNIFINIVGCANDSILNSLIRKKQRGEIKNFIVSTSDIYKAINYENIIVGFEQWKYNGKSSPLRELDSTVRLTTDLRLLLPEVERIVDIIDGAEPENDIEKIILVDGWIQKHIQYIISRTTKSNDGICYVCEGLKNPEANTEDAIIHHFGRCEDISFLASIIFNHPKIGIKCRQVGSADFNTGFNHSWNIVTCDKKEYYLDCTHNITRNPNRHPSAFKSLSYSTVFTLLGVDDAKAKYGIPECFDSRSFSALSYDRNELKKAIDRLVERRVFSLTWDTPPALDSYIQS